MLGVFATVYVRRTNVQKDKKTNTCLHFQPSQASRNKTCSIVGALDDSQGQRHNTTNQILSDRGTLDPALILHLSPMTLFLDYQNSLKIPLNGFNIFIRIHIKVNRYIPLISA